MEYKRNSLLYNKAINLFSTKGDVTVSSQMNVFEKLTVNSVKSDQQSLTLDNCNYINTHHK